MKLRVRALSALTAVAALSACSNEGELVIDQGIGIASVLSLCPSVGIPDYTGDITTFRNPADTTVSSLDVSAAMTGLRSECNDTADKIYSEASFTVNARRSDTGGARTVELPYFVTVVRGGTAVVSKRIGTVTLAFADGQDRAQGTGKVGAYVNRVDAALPEDIREKITKRRRAGDAEAALDPLADPEVKAAIARTRFEMLVGFQLTEAQLRYNVTR